MCPPRPLGTDLVEALLQRSTPQPQASANVGALAALLTPQPQTSPKFGALAALFNSVYTVYVITDGYSYYVGNGLPGRIEESKERENMPYGKILVDNLTKDQAFYIEKEIYDYMKFYGEFDIRNKISPPTKPAPMGVDKLLEEAMNEFYTLLS